MTVSPKQLFLVDGLGAVLSAFLIGIVLAGFESIFGMPQEVTYFLSIIPCLYAIYSFTCFRLIQKNWKPYLRFIALANLLYGCLTIGLVIYFYPHVTGWGLLYFIGEVIIIIGLAAIELKNVAIHHPA